MTRQKCTLCGEPSIPGMTKGHGKCQYHWNLLCYGKPWADHCLEKDKEKNTES